MTIDPCEVRTILIVHAQLRICTVVLSHEAEAGSSKSQVAQPCDNVTRTVL